MVNSPDKSRQIHLGNYNVSDTNLNIIKDVNEERSPVISNKPKSIGNRESNIGLDLLVNPHKIKAEELETKTTPEKDESYINDALAESEVDNDDILNMVQNNRSQNRFRSGNSLQEYFKKSGKQRLHMGSS